MFVLLTRVLLWVLIGIILWYIFIRFIPKVYLTWLGGLLLFTFVVLAFLDPTDRVVGIAWSILSLPLKPLGLAIVLLAGALSQGVKKVTGNQVAAALLVLIVFSLPVTAYWMTSQMQVSNVETSQALGDLSPTPDTVRAIVVLGEGVAPTDPSYRTRGQFGNVEEGIDTALASRLLYAGRLYQEQVGQGNTPWVIVSAVPQPVLTTQNGNEEQAIRQVLTNQSGVPRDRIVIDADSINARGSAREVDDLLQERGFRKSEDRIILVAPAVGVRRAASTFAQLGFGVVLRPTDLFGFQTPGNINSIRLADLVPSVDALAVTTRVVEEYLTLIYYFLRGWLIDPLGF